MEAGETSEPATSLCSFGGSVLFNDEGFEIFEETGKHIGDVTTLLLVSNGVGTGVLREGKPIPMPIYANLVCFVFVQ